MKQNLQQSAVQRAMQPVARQINTGLNPFDISDTDDAIQQQADDNAAALEDLQLRKKRKEKDFIDVFTNDLSNPTQIDSMMASSSKSSIRGNLTGTSSSSAAAASQEDALISIPSQGE